MVENFLIHKQTTYILASTGDLDHPILIKKNLFSLIFIPGTSRNSVNNWPVP